LAKESGERLATMIGKASLFSALSQEQLKKLGKTGTERSFDAGKVIIKEGESGVGFYLVLDGKVEVRRKGKVLSTLSAGDFFGEMGLIDDQPRSADVVAVSPTTTFCLSPWSFAGAVTGNPEIALKMMKVLIGRLRTSSKALTE
jgi:CRP-like cAMP-binding protein